jgi:hypothetical protein
VIILGFHFLSIVRLLNTFIVKETFAFDPRLFSFLDYIFIMLPQVDFIFIIIFFI